MTIDSDGEVILGNEAAQQLLPPGGAPLQEQAIQSTGPRLNGDTSAHKALLRQRFERSDWECPQILEALDRTNDLVTGGR